MGSDSGGKSKKKRKIEDAKRTGDISESGEDGTQIEDTDKYKPFIKPGHIETYPENSPAFEFIVYIESIKDKAISDKDIMYLSNIFTRDVKVFKERWFRLKNNCLYYFKINDVGKFDTRNPEGVFILENSRFEIDDGESLPFAFSLRFLDDVEKRHIFAARSEENVTQWITKLKAASYEYLRSQLYLLQSKIFHLTGKDPLLLVPRNEGSMKWPPQPPTASPPPSNSMSNNKGFHCHVHNHTSTSGKCKSLMRSAQCYSAFTESVDHTQSRIHHSETVSNITTSFEQSSLVSSSRHIGKSKTSAAIVSKSILNDSLFNSPELNVPLYVRPAPSPPVRKKNSPRMNRTTEVNESTSGSVNETFVERSRLLGSTSILQEPIAPKRKISPKLMQGEPEKDNKAASDTRDEDLIKF